MVCEAVSAVYRAAWAAYRALSVVYKALVSAAHRDHPSVYAAYGVDKDPADDAQVRFTVLFQLNFTGLCIPGNVAIRYSQRISQKPDL